MRIDPRVFAFALTAGAALAACSGSFGSGSSVPQGAGLPSGPFVAPSPSPAPTSATGILSYGRNAGFQALPTIGGFGGAIAFPVPAGSAAPADEISIGVTTSLAKPPAAPDLNLVSGKGKRAKHRANPARALFFVTLLPTHDATLPEYPRMAIDVPREIAAAYRDGDYGLGLYNEGDKDKAFRLAVAERAGASPAPSGSPNGSPAPSGSARATASAAASAAASASPAPSPSGSGSPNPFATPRGSAAPSASPTLPPQRIVFDGTATPLRLVANRAVTFAVYALPPKATPSPEPSAPALKGVRASAVPAASGSPLADASPAASGSASASAAARPSASATPSAGASASAAAAASAAASTSPAPR